MMKYITLVTISILTTSLFGQMPNAASMQSSAPEGTSLGANNTLTANGIALGNRVKMRGFVDFRFDYTDLDDLRDDDKRFRTASDLDFLFDFSPVTGEVHLAASSGGVAMEQAFLRYNFNRDFSFTAGRQLTALSFEKDEAPNMYQTSYAYLTDESETIEGGRVALQKFIGIDSSSSFRTAGTSVYSSFVSSGENDKIDADKTFADTNTLNTTFVVGSSNITTAVGNAATGTGTDEQKALYAAANYLRDNQTPVNPGAVNLPTFRRNYVDGIRLNYNNGQFGIVGGLHNGYFTNTDDGSHLNDGNIGLDIAASVMIIPGLEFRLGFGYENNDQYNEAVSPYNTWASGLKSAISPVHAATAAAIPVFPHSDDISQFNSWLSYQTGGLTLALEFDIWDVYVIDMWNLMFLANYQFNDFFGLTFRYSHEDFEADVPGGGEGDSNRFTIGPMFTITDYLTIGIEYSHAELDSTNTGDTDIDELYAETIFSF